MAKTTALPTKNQIANLWAQEYAPKRHCGLCGNGGVLDTRGVRTAAGLECGGRFWCICPNGRALKHQTGTDHPLPPERS